MDEDHYSDAVGEPDNQFQKNGGIKSRFESSHAQGAEVTHHGLNRGRKSSIQLFWSATHHLTN